MKFFVVIYLKSPGETLFVETTLAGRCLFTKWVSRAKFFTEDQANDLLIYLKNAKYNEKEKFIKKEVPEEYNVHDSAVREKEKANQGSNTPSNTFRETKGNDDRK